MIEIPLQKDKIAIIAVGYNRLKSLSRLLNSLLNAVYPAIDVPLVISIDASGDTELYEYVKNFIWPYGTKYVNIQKERLGLRNHIYQCADMTKSFKAIILLEDDLYVSPFFYNYVSWAVEKYADDERIAEISLYKNETNGYVGLPFHQQENGHDVFLMQDVSTWGECFTEKMWASFKSWLSAHDEKDIFSVDMPKTIKGWTNAWSKYYNAYVTDTEKYVLYPIVPVSTNFSDAGVHGTDNNSLVQVNILYADKEYVYVPFDDLVKYDIYFNNEALYNWIDICKEDICLDIYGFNEARNNKRYLLSTRTLPYKIVKGFSLNLRPLEMNVAMDIEGEDILLYDRKYSISRRQAGYYTKNVFKYFFQGIRPSYMVYEAFRHYLKRFFKR